MGATRVTGPLYSDGGFVHDGKSGTGIKYGDRDSTTAYGWADITGQVLVKGVGVADPTWAQIASGPFYAYKFAVNDNCWFCYHVPHDIVPGTDIHFHVHWIHDGTGSNPTEPVKWEFTYAYALGFNQAAFDMDTGTTINAETTPAATAYQHYVTETAAVSIATLTEPDGLIYCSIKRITNGGTENDAGVFMLTSDVHYQSPGLLSTPGKAPGFYNT